ncbi:MAG: hypothetical protein ACEPOZ_21330 [Marinifilaceae bacterium]
MNIPIELLVFALSCRKVNPVKLYLCLKAMGAGHLLLTPGVKKAIREQLALRDQRTLEANLNWLLKKGWVTLNRKRGSLRVVGYPALARKLGFRCATGALFTPDQFPNFRPFIYAAVVTYYLQYKYRTAKQSERKKGRSRTNCSCRDLPAKYLALVLRLGKSTVIRYRQRAWDAGYIKMRHRYQPALVPIEHLDFCRIYGDEEAYQLVIHNGRVMVQLSNAITSYIQLRTKPSLKKCIRHLQKVDPL